MAAAKKSAARSTKAKAKAPRAAAPALLETMPPEVLSIILDSVEDKKGMAALCGTCKDLYELMMPRLHRRVIVSAEHFAQIQTMIRTVERYLSIAQKKEIKKMGAYKGQQETYPSGVDENKVPDSTRFIRELVIGSSSPGKKHDKITHRYIEEFVNNVPDVRVLEAYMMTSFIAKRLPVWKGITALSINVEWGNMDDDAARGLKGFKNLEHLVMNGNIFCADSQRVGPTLLKQSASTLRTLHLDHSGFEINLEPMFPPKDKSKTQFKHLERLDLFNTRVTQQGADAALAVVDFTQLSELNLPYVWALTPALYRPLAEAFKKAVASRRGIKLRRLLLEANYDYDHSYQNCDQPEDVIQEARFGFLASFSQLEALEITNYRSYSRGHQVRPHGFPSAFTESVLKHQGLKSPKVTNRSGTTARISYLSPDDVSTLLLGLPNLESFEFYPDEWDMDGVIQCLPLGNLSSITCNMYEAEWIYNESDPKFMARFDMLQPILEAYLNYDGSDPWLEKMNTLRMVSVKKMQSQHWLIFTQKPGKGSSQGLKVRKAAQKMSSKDGKRTIWYQEVAVPKPELKGYDTGLKWMKLVSSYK